MRHDAEKRAPAAQSTATAPLRLTPARLVRFFRELALDGRMNAGTSAIHCTAIHHMLGRLPEDQELTLDADEIDAFFTALQRREGARLKVATLQTYRGTFERAVELYRTWAAVPRDERPLHLTGRRPSRLSERRPHPSGLVSEHLVPLAPTRVAELRLPGDLTADEARRLARFVRALADDGPERLASGAGDGATPRSPRPPASAPARAAR
jgi:hypothetical protein